MIYRKPNDNRLGMTYHIPRGNIAPIPTYQCQAIMSSLIWFCNAQGDQSFSATESIILEKAIKVVFDAYNNRSDEKHEDKTHASPKQLLALLEARMGSRSAGQQVSIE